MDGWALVRDERPKAVACRQRGRSGERRSLCAWCVSCVSTFVFLACIILVREEPFDGTLWISVLQVLRISIKRKSELVSERTKETGMSPHTVWRRAFLACGREKPISANVLICSGVGSGPLRLLVVWTIGASISTHMTRDNQNKRPSSEVGRGKACLGPPCEQRAIPSRPPGRCCPSRATPSGTGSAGSPSLRAGRVRLG